MSFYTYGHYTESGRLFYIGKGKGARAYCKTSRNKYWHNVVKKHGLKVEIFSRWESEKEALSHEMFLIKCFRDDLNVVLCNMTDGGEGSSGHVMSEEAKSKISELSLARWQDPAFRAKMDQRPVGSFTEKKRISSLENAKLARATLVGEKKLEVQKTLSVKSKEMWSDDGFRSSMSEKHRTLWDEERRARQSKATSGRVRVTNGIVERNVLQSEADVLLTQGWIRGRGPNSPAKRVKSN